MVLSQQLKGTQRSKVVSERGTILLIGDLGKEYLFCQKWYTEE